MTHAHDPLLLVQDADFEKSYYNEGLAAKIIHDLLSVSVEEIISVIDRSEINLNIHTIPMFNDFYIGTHGICEYLSTVKLANYVDTGTYFTSEHNQIPARQKYGELHLKLGALLGYVALCKPPGSKVMVGTLTPLGKEALALPEELFTQLSLILILRIDAVSRLIQLASTELVKVQTSLIELGMKKTTVERRTQSMKVLFKKLNNINCFVLRERLSKIYW